MDKIDWSPYTSHLNISQYLQLYYGKILIFRLQPFKEFFLKYSCKWDKSSAKLLDFSGGAVIANYISAAPYVAEIVHSAYTEEERRQLELWVRDAEGAFNWNPYIKYVVSNIEGQEGESAWQERAALLRSKIKVVSCNIYDDHPIGLEQDQFSIICTSYALEVACKSYDDFKVGIKVYLDLVGILSFYLMNNYPSTMWVKRNCLCFLFHWHK